ncbi:MAG: hypothetical protein QOF76_592 [Solirubrobacteraceae bacterium]|jgi:SAM-dependent methyltransferase|nr:hypothetical protein [Solirubrobacteraceae bacterium]
MPLALDGPFPPIPPADLVSRVTQQFDPAHREAASQAFHAGAVDHIRQFEAAAELVGRSFNAAQRVLDFGCGPGRLMRLLGECAAAGVELHGVDVDGDLIDWAAANIPFSRFVQGPHEPPLPYPDGHFDLVLSHSVFTHIDRERQDWWLAELRRVTAPGGLLLLTVHSTRQWNQAMIDMSGAGDDASAYQRELEGTGLKFFSEDLFIGTTHPDWYHSTFHAPWYVFEHWATFFSLRAYIPEGSHSQDLIVLERPADDDPLRQPIGHGSAAAAPVEPTNPQALSDAAASARFFYEQSGARTSRWGRVRERMLRGELRRADAVNAYLIAAVETLATNADREDMRAEFRTMRRTVGVLRGALDDQARREALLAAELRGEIAELRARIDAS